ncbi:MAG: hypothetical protein JW740_02855 [Candidatus Zambryskibacteria bacterium]|nr:hypothetical protein [Candidatus Zambryskibacteria bacterium]
MKKILLSAAVIIPVLALVVGGTIAFYNDTETSSGNIFTAGSIDLKVDHLKQTYNGIDCETCSLVVYSSDGSNYVTGSSDLATVQEGFPYLAPSVSSPHPNWTTHDIADWIWAQPSTSQNDAENEVEYTFERNFYWNGVVGDIIFEMSLASDNGYAIYVNDIPLVDHLADEFNYNAIIQPLDLLETEFKNALHLGSNTLKIIVRNHAPDGWQGTPTTNPAGLLYYLNIERTDCNTDLGFQEACRLWTEKDLDEGDTFFTFGDIKPADWGTNVISLHVGSNDAYACLLINNKDDQENNIYDPEAELNDVTDPEGELSNYLDVFTWMDADGDGVFDVGEIVISGLDSMQDLYSIMSLDNEEQYLMATSTKLIGLVWCAGDLEEPIAGSPFVCDGAGMLNDAQSDSFSADLTAYAEQMRNNPDFDCDEVKLDGDDDGPVLPY